MTARALINETLFGWGAHQETNKQVKVVFADLSRELLRCSDVDGIDDVLRELDDALGASHLLVQQRQLDNVKVVVEQVDLFEVVKKKKKKAERRALQVTTRDQK